MKGGGLGQAVGSIEIVHDPSLACYNGGGHFEVSITALCDRIYQFNV